jgi:hypothetical protein
MSLSEKLKNAKMPTFLWKGPVDDGITQSMLGQFLLCRERFRIKYLLGIQPVHRFRAVIVFGELWHLCREKEQAGEDWEAACRACAVAHMRQNKQDQQEIMKWFNVCVRLFKCWLEHHDTLPHIKHSPIAEELVFAVPYTVYPSEWNFHSDRPADVLLRGKFDGVTLRDGKIWLQEIKTKGQIDEKGISFQLSFDLQTMLYLTALQQMLNHGLEPFEDYRGMEVGGVLYDIVRRPLSGGRGSIKQLKPTKKRPKGESMEEYLNRLEEYFYNEPEYFFMQWEVGVTQHELANFNKKFLKPILEDLCEWYNFMTSKMGRENPFHHSGHWQAPSMMFNPFVREAGTPYDHYLADGSMVGLHRVDSLFNELQEPDYEGAGESDG